MFNYLKSFRFLPILFATMVLVTAAPAWAQSDQGLDSRKWGVGQPRHSSDLPPGQLRRKLENLPPQANARALKWLQDISFSAMDLEVLQIDNEGGVYFIETELPQAVENAATDRGPTPSSSAPQSTLDDAFKLHSKPGAPNVVYIDFNGHNITGTVWNTATGAPATFVARPYDLDGNPESFNNEERTRIVDIWHRVSEDLAIFDIDVTTEEPSSFNNRTGHLLVTPNTDANGNNMPHHSAGGVAYIGVFGISNYATYYSPALVYSNQLGNGAITIAEASSHEFGHNLGLGHDGTATSTYYSGHGSNSDLVSWAPIMGAGYYKNVTQWSKGEYAGASNTEDDLAIIQDKLAYRGDDHGNTIGSGTALFVAGDGGVTSSNPELDPHNVLPENKGIINSASDVDVFTFGAAAGPVSLMIRPAWDAFYRATQNRGANLDIKAELRNAAGALLATNDPNNDTMATINYTVAAGTYHLLVSAVNNAISPYSNYGSQGMYFINGSVAPASGDSVAPTPNPMSWASVPAATGENSITMTASTATDETSAVQYRFNCVSGGAGCTNSAWQSGTSYTATGLAAATQYTFTVVARDQAGNQTAASLARSATTDASSPPVPPDFVNHTANNDFTRSGTVSGSFSDTHTDDGVVQSITEVESGGKLMMQYSYLEHSWSFNIDSGASATIRSNAWSSGSSDGDSFIFEYSLDGGSSWQSAYTVTATSSNATQSFEIPGAPSGNILVRVVDSDKSRGATEPNTVFVDHLYIEVATQSSSSSPPPSPPSNLEANGSKKKGRMIIDLTWSGDTSVDVYRNGSQIATVSGNSYSDDTGAKGSANWTHKVCEAGSIVNCSNTTSTKF